MLKHSKRLSTRLPGAARVVVVGLLAVVGVGVVGLRHPQGPVVKAADDQKLNAQLQESPAATKPLSEKFDLSYIPENVIAVMGVRPAAIFANPEWESLAKIINETKGFQKASGISIQEIEQITGVLFAETLEQGQLFTVSRDRTPQPQKNRNLTLIVRTARPHDFQSFLDATAESVITETHGDQTFHKLGQTGLGYFSPDDRTVVFGEEPSVKIILNNGPAVNAKFDKRDSWKEIEQDHLFLAVNSTAVPREINQVPFLQVFEPLWTQSESLVVGVQVKDVIEIRGRMACPSESDASHVKETLVAAITLLKNAAQQNPHRNKSPLDMAKDIIEGLRVSHDRNVVRIDSPAKIMPEVAREWLMQFVQMQQIKSLQDIEFSEQQKLEQITLAMHKYHAANGHLPPAVVIGPDVKTPHSWRVELLPFLGLGVDGDQYLGYKLDEPWDSEHNKAVIQRMPSVYGHDADSTNAAYFVFTGPGTAFGEKKGLRFADVKDGMSQTLMIVEAKRDIPWTKPEDIPFDTVAPLPKLGGYTPGKILAAKFDGRNVVIPAQGIPEKLWRAAISYDGGEVISDEFFKMTQETTKP